MDANRTRAEALHPGAEPLDSGPSLRETAPISRGLTRQQAIVQAEREAYVENLVGNDLSNLPGWAGGFINHADGGTTYLQVADEASYQALLARNLPDWIVIRLVKHSFAELQAVHDDLSAALQKAAPGASTTTDQPIPDYNIETSMQQNKVLVTLDVNTSPAVRSVIDQYAGDDRVAQSTEQLEPLHQSSCPADSCGTYKGGMALDYPGGLCSAGFTFEKSGLTYASTAGHCGNHTFYHSGQVVGDSYDAYVIVARSLDYQISTIHDRTAWKASNTVWRPSNSSFPITQKVHTPSSGLEGVTVCHVGVGLILHLGDDGESCGQILSVDASPGDWLHMGKASFRTCRSDSGGPVFTSSTHRAYGLLRGYTAGGALCSSPTPSETYFTWVSNIEQVSPFDVKLTS